MTVAETWMNFFSDINETYRKDSIPEVGDTNFWVLESESGIMPMSKRIQYWIRDSEKKLNETESETETKKKP